MRTNRFSLLLFLFLALCVSCATNKTVSPNDAASAHAVLVTNTALFYLLPTSSVEKKLDTVQYVQARFGTQEFTARCRLLANTHELSLTLLNSEGTALGGLNYNTDLVVCDAALFPPAIQADSLVADMQFCLYRVDTLTNALKESGLHYVVSVAATVDGGTVEARSIFDGKKEIIRIEKTATHCTYTNFLRDYAYVISNTLTH